MLKCVKDYTYIYMYIYAINKYENIKYNIYMHTKYMYIYKCELALIGPQNAQT